MKSVYSFYYGQEVTFWWAGLSTEVKGTIVRKGRTKLGVQQEDEEVRYRRRTYRKGTVWTVNPGDCWKVEDATPEITEQAQRIVTALERKPGLMATVAKLLRMRNA